VGAELTISDNQGPLDPAETMPRLKAVLEAAARDRTALTYTETLNALGHRFTRPRMRALSRMLLSIDAEQAAFGRPGLAVLVVRQSDRIPGQGWWMSQTDYAGLWTGREALAYVTREQARAFDDYCR